MFPTVIVVPISFASFNSATEYFDLRDNSFLILSLISASSTGLSPGGILPTSIPLIASYFVLSIEDIFDGGSFDRPMPNSFAVRSLSCLSFIYSCS